MAIAVHKLGPEAVAKWRDDCERWREIEARFNLDQRNPSEGNPETHVYTESQKTPCKCQNSF